MSTVRVYTREVTVNLGPRQGECGHTFKALLPSFDPITETSSPLSQLVLGPRSSFDVELPRGYEIKALAEPDHKCVASPDGQHLDVFDVVRRLEQGSDGFRLASPPSGDH
jgi:hypothetical protein